MASSTEIPLVTLLPRAWIGFSRGPWRCVGLAALVLISASGPAVIGHDLRLAGSPWLNRLGDLSVLISLALPLLPLLGLLQLTDGLLPDRRDDRPQQCWRQLLRWWGRWRLIQSPETARQLIADGWPSGPALGDELRRRRCARLDQCR